MHQTILLQEGVSQEKISQCQIPQSQSFSPAEKMALEYAEAITISDRSVSDQLFASLQSHFSEDEILELTAAIAFQNLSSKFNEALKLPKQSNQEPSS